MFQIHSMQQNLTLPNYKKKFATTTTNAVYDFEDDGIHISSINDNEKRYYLHIDTKDFNDATYFTAVNVNLEAQFIITLTGDEDVIFYGGRQPTLASRTVFVIQGERHIVVYSDVYGNLIAPDAILVQLGGDEIGLTVIGSVIDFVESKKPDCSVVNYALMAEKFKNDEL